MSRSFYRFFSLCSLICLLGAAAASGQVYHPITHTSGTQTVSGMNVTVTGTGFTGSGANFCGVTPYALGRNPSFLSGYGKYTFAFGAPVAGIRVLIAAMDAGATPALTERDSFFINGVYFPLTNANYTAYPGPCNQPQGLVSNGIFTTINTSSGGQIDINNMAISTLSVSTNGVADGNIIGVFFTYDANVIAGNNGPLCTGQTLNLTASSIVNATYSWTGPNSFTSTAQNPTLPNVTTTAAGRYIVTAVANGVTTVDSTTVVVNQTPAAPALGSNSPVCSGNTLNLTATTVTGGTYAWTGPNSFASGLQNPSITNVTTAANGTYTATVTAAGCTSPPGTVSVIIAPTPNITNVTPSNPTGCGFSNGQLSFTGLAPNTSYTINYTRNGAPVTTTLTSSTAGTLVLTGLNAATYNNIVISSGGCNATPKGPYTLVDPAAPPPPAVSSNSPVCVGGNLQLNATGAGAGTYSWTGPNSFTSGVQNPVISPVTAAAAGTYTVVYNVNGCTSSAGTTVSIATAPSAPTVSSNSPACIGGTLSLSANATGATGYSWNGPNSFTSNQQNPNVGPVTAATAGTYTVTASIGGCTSAPASVTVTTQPQPAPPVPNNVTYCKDATNAVPLTATGTNLLWYTTPTGGTGSATAPIPNTTTPQTYYVTQTNSNGCESQRAALTVTINQPPAPVVVSPVTLCQFQVAAPLTATGGGLLWYSTPTGGTPSATAPVPATGIAGTFHYYVSQTVAGCISSRAQITVIVNAKPAPPTVISPLGLCQYDTVSLTASGAPNGSFTWYYTATGGVGVPNIIPNTAYEDSAYYYVTQTVNGCESDRARLRVFVSYKPNGIVLPTRIWVCEGELDSFSYFGNATPPQAVFNWTTSRPNNQIVSGQGTTGPLVVRFDSAGLHYVRVQVNNRGCLSEIASQPVSVRPNPRLTFQVKDEACQDEVINVALSAVSPLIDSFKYAFPGAQIVYGANSGGPYGISYSTPGIKVISTMATTRECPSRIYYDTITVHPLPDARFVVGSRTGNCAGDSVLLRIVNGDSATRYVWTPDHFFSTGNIFEAWGVVKSSGYVKVSAQTQYGCKAADSMLINAGSCCELYFPNAFSPNNDTKNDVFRPVTYGHHEIKTFRIINRWGQVVYESKDDRGYWDGTFNGKEQEVGTYYYYIRFNCLEGGLEDVEQKGELLLVR